MQSGDKFWYTILVILLLIALGYLIYSYKQGKSGNEKYMTFYNLVHNPSWKNFKIWFAKTMNEPLFEIFLFGIIVLMPLPFLPQHPHNRIELLFQKLGIYLLLTTLILGRPHYSAYEKQTMNEYIFGWVVIGGIFIIALGSWLSTKKFMCEIVSKINNC